MTHYTWSGSAAAQGVLNSMVAAIGGDSRITVLESNRLNSDGAYAGLSTAYYTWVVRFNHATHPFYTIFYVSSTINRHYYYFVAETWDAVTKQVTHLQGLSGGTPSTVYADDSYWGPDPINLTSGAAVYLANMANYGFTHQAEILDSAFLFGSLNQSGAGLCGGFLFDTLLAAPADDSLPLGILYKGAFTNQVRAVTTPYAGDLSSPVPWTDGVLGTWANGTLTGFTPDPYNVANPNAYPFTPVVVYQGSFVGGQARGVVPDVLYSQAGTVGESIVIAGDGLYVKRTATLWFKEGAA